MQIRKKIQIVSVQKFENIFSSVGVSLDRFGDARVPLKHLFDMAQSAQRDRRSGPKIANV